MQINVNLSVNNEAENNCLFLNPQLGTGFVMKTFLFIGISKLKNVISLFLFLLLIPASP